MKSEEKLDRRVAKTKKAIKNAFINLLAEKDVNDISITNVAAEADVDRKTVYNYYSGVFAIQEEIETEFVELMSGVISEVEHETLITNPYHIFESMTEVISENIEFYSRLLKVDANSHILRKIISMLKVQLKDALLRSAVKDSPKLDLICEYITSGMVAAYQSWFNSERTQSLEEFSLDVGNLVIGGVRGFVRN
ncbi:MAG: TetR family transcriptional regulator C-terminal domain-containing protein [Clostridia bacterium]|nr:TetR family transcriptional regulator C-terminal domain-containing protein [Clostridia bacterium]